MVRLVCGSHRRPYLLDQLFDPETVLFLQSIAQEIIRVEGPLEPNRFARLIGQACGMHRVVAKRVRGNPGHAPASPRAR